MAIQNKPLQNDQQESEVLMQIDISARSGKDNSCRHTEGYTKHKDISNPESQHEWEYLPSRDVAEC